MPGTWVLPPSVGLLWTPGYWGWRDGLYVWSAGYWGPRVGFYGGVNYGYGYIGTGYVGGFWEHGAFYYNHAANNFGSVHVTNVYSKTIVNNTRVSRVSFNGGPGGIRARPTPKQEAFGRQRHVGATPVQRQQSEVASKDRSLFSKQNHGEPAVAATPRPGMFQVEAVMPPTAARPVTGRRATEAAPGEPARRPRSAASA